MASEDEAPGWDSIEAAFGAIYLEPPVHVAPPLGQQPPFAGGVLNGISAYRGKEHWHLVSFGLTDLFQKTSDEGSVSGWGYELTVTTAVEDDQPPQWAFELLMGIARTTVRHGERYEAGVRLGTGPIPGDDSKLVAVAFAPDGLVQPTQFPFGEYCFLQAVGVTQSEREEMQRSSTEAVLARLRAEDSLLRTDPARAPVCCDLGPR